MSERGFFAIDRGVWEHPMFAHEKFSEREAWFWLISSAAWEPTKVRIGRNSFDLERGQCVFALRFLAQKWMWSEPRVRRFLDRLTRDAAVLVSATREATRITICNYNDYQLSRRADVAEIDAPLESKSTNPRRKEEQINNKQEKDAADAAQVVQTPEQEYFRRVKEICGQSAGGLAKKLLEAKGGSIPLARAAAEQASVRQDPREYLGAIIRNKDSPATDRFAGRAF